MSIKSLAHVSIKTRDLERTRNFYCDALGMKKIFNFTKNGEAIGFYLKANNNSFIEVFRAAADDTALSSGNPNHFCLETESLETLRQRLAERGHAPTEIIMGADHALQFWVQDPNGLNIEIQQYIEQSSQFTGKDVEVN